MTARPDLPRPERVRKAADELLAEATRNGVRPSALTLAHRVGLSNTTFHRPYRDIVETITTARNATTEPSASRHQARHGPRPEKRQAPQSEPGTHRPAGPRPRMRPAPGHREQEPESSSRSVLPSHPPAEEPVSGTLLPVLDPGAVTRMSLMEPRAVLLGRRAEVDGQADQVEADVAGPDRAHIDGTQPGAVGRAVGYSLPLVVNWRSRRHRSGACSGPEARRSRWRGRR